MHLPAKVNSLSVQTFMANKSLSDSDSVCVCVFESVKVWGEWVCVCVAAGVWAEPPFPCCVSAVCAAADEPSSVVLQRRRDLLAAAQEHLLLPGSGRVRKGPAEEQYRTDVTHLGKQT